MVLFGEEDSRPEVIAQKLGITQEYAEALKDLMGLMPGECALCWNKTEHVYLFRPADGTEAELGKPSSPTRCRVAMQRLCPACIASLGPDGIEEHFRANVRAGNVVFPRVERP